MHGVHKHRLSELEIISHDLKAGLLMRPQLSETETEHAIGDRNQKL